MTLPDNCAFPNPSSDAVGLTKREWLAGIICAGISSNPSEELERNISSLVKSTQNVPYEIIACWSVQQADALIAALNKPKE